MIASDIVTKVEAMIGKSKTVTPKQFARLKSEVDQRDYSLRSAQLLFEQLSKKGMASRAGTQTRQFPNGKIFVMSREHCIDVLSGKVQL